MRCPEGHDNPDTARLCQACGAELATTAVPIAPGLPAVSLPPVPAETEGDEFVAKAPTGAGNDAQTEPSPAARRRRRWIGPVIALVVVVAAVGTVGFLTGRADERGVCEAGVRWEQRPSPFRDGTLIRVSSRLKAAVIQGGARLKFPDKREADAMLASDFRDVTSAEWDALDTVPSEGLVLRERPHKGGTNRVFYSAGGAVYEIHDPETLRGIGVDPSRAIVIPTDGLSQSRKVPPTGMLLRRKGDDTTWVITGARRQAAGELCDGARVITLPRDESVLDAIPLAR